jgi:diphthamide synthase (EF-2-diphthine--ammonia ligase)
MNIAIWVSGTLNGQSLLNWAREQKHDAKCLLSMQSSGAETLAWATGNIDELKKVSDTNKVDLIFKSVKKSGVENFDALDSITKYAKEKYKVEAIAVSKSPEVAHPIRNSAKKVGLKVVLLPK